MTLLLLSIIPSKMIFDIWTSLGKKMNKRENKKISSLQLVPRNGLITTCLLGRKKDPNTNIPPSEGRFLDLIARNTFSRFVSLLHVFSIVWVYLNLGYSSVFFFFRLNSSAVLMLKRSICSGRIHFSGISWRKKRDHKDIW